MRGTGLTALAGAFNIVNAAGATKDRWASWPALVPSSSSESALPTLWLTASSWPVSRRRYTPDPANDAAEFSLDPPLCSVPEVGSMNSRRTERVEDTQIAEFSHSSATPRRPEIKCLVRVACSENRVAEAQAYRRPPESIIQLSELEVALQVEQGQTGRYIHDFGCLLADSVPAAHAGTDTRNFEALVCVLRSGDKKG
ncbi:hypothetical protein B0H16DRAFT_1834500 [Mycena metata]|uniref:Uncharacterized protein n=1 Tax=Mycena metata TaxID=1033252 RepID=A0AAD7IYV2_9AGAR|nr:hypothetical protein B0H16DRAFT_1834500 [Mycena metata]